MSKGFKIGGFLSSMPQEYPIKEPIETETMMIDVYKLKNNDKNPYDLEEIESLAEYLTYGANIPLIEVAKKDGEYIIWSGHRRTRAIIYGLEHGYQYPKHIIDKGQVKVIIKDFDKEAQLYGQGIYTAEDFQILDLVLPNKGQRRNISISTCAAEIDMLEPIVRKKFDYDKTKGSFRAYFAMFLGISESNLQRYFSYRKLSTYIKEAISQEKIRFTVATDHLSKLAIEEQDALVAFFEQQNIDVTEKAVLSHLKKDKEELTSLDKADSSHTSTVDHVPVMEHDLETRGQMILSNVESTSGMESLAPESKEEPILENWGLESVLLDKIPSEYGQLTILLKSKEGGFVAGFTFKSNKEGESMAEPPLISEIPKEKDIAVKEEIDFLLEYGPAAIKEALYAGKYAIKQEETPSEKDSKEEITAFSENKKIRFEEIKSSVTSKLSNISAIRDKQQFINELKSLKDYINQILSEEL